MQVVPPHLGLLSLLARNRLGAKLQVGQGIGRVCAPVLPFLRRFRLASWIVPSGDRHHRVDMGLNTLSVMAFQCPQRALAGECAAPYWSGKGAELKHYHREGPCDGYK